jgi:hypothetical protein
LRALLNLCLKIRDSSVDFRLVLLELLNVILERLHLGRVDAVILQGNHETTISRTSEYSAHLAQELPVALLPHRTLLLQALDLDVTRLQLGLCTTKLLLRRIQFRRKLVKTGFELARALLVPVALGAQRGVAFSQNSELIDAL